MASPSSEPLHSTAPAPPALANGKASAAPPKVTDGTSVELNEMAPPEAKLPLHEDIMQLARLGEIGPIQTLFDSGRYNARYKDQEDITPLHVRQDVSHGVMRYEICSQTNSGPRSTIIMRSVNTSSNPAQRSTQKAASPSQPLQCGPRNDVTSTLSTCCLGTAQTLFSPMDRVTTCFI